MNSFFGLPGASAPGHSERRVSDTNAASGSTGAAFHMLRKAITHHLSRVS
ncbi:hypothetical protein [Yoonia sp.]